MNVGYDSGWDRVLLLWPIIVRHVINEDSPLYGMTRDNIAVFGTVSRLFMILPTFRKLNLS